MKISIHAPTRGATYVTRTILSNQTDFNPRSHKGSDIYRRSFTNNYSNISIHAPTRGATVTAEAREPDPEISIHAPTRGATCD